MARSSRGHLSIERHVSSSEHKETGTVRGREFREQRRRSDLGVLAPRPTTYDPVERLQWQGASRIAELLPLRYQRMLAGPLAFYRGTALLMAEDLARGPSSPIVVQSSGDAHLSNFSLYSSPERRLVFDIDDFDETDTGPFEWDLKRLATSIVVASRHLGHDLDRQERLARSAAREYRTAIRRFAAQGHLNVWYASLDVNAVVEDLGGYFTDNVIRRVDRVVGRAHQMDVKKNLAKVVTYQSGQPRFVSSPPLLVPLDGLSADTYLGREELVRIVRGYSSSLPSDRQVLLGQFTPVDAARKVVGVGSVGTECYAILLTGRDDEDLFLLQVKEAGTSVLATAQGRKPEVGVCGAERVVRGQRLMQAATDGVLGWYAPDATSGRSFYVRQLFDDKATVDVERLDEKLLDVYGRICAWVLARAHARGGNGSVIAGYLGKSDVTDEAVAHFAVAYAKRVTEDLEALRVARDDGRITVAQ